MSGQRIIWTALQSFEGQFFISLRYYAWPISQVERGTKHITKPIPIFVDFLPDDRQTWSPLGWHLGGVRGIRHGDSRSKAGYDARKMKGLAVNDRLG